MTRMKADLMTLYGVFFILFLYVPVLLIPLFSFNDSTVATFPLKGFTLEGYRRMAADASLINALKNSLIVAGLCTLRVRLGDAHAV